MVSNNQIKVVRQIIIEQNSLICSIIVIRDSSQSYQQPMSQKMVARDPTVTRKIKKRKVVSIL